MCLDARLNILTPRSTSVPLVTVRKSPENPMNSFAHALPFLDRPLVAIGASLPDWMAAADRRCRLREKRAKPFTDHEDSVVAGLAQGVVQHHRDDYWFHTSPAFRDYEMKMAIEIREIYGTEHGMRSGFVAHVMVEMFQNVITKSSRTPMRPKSSNPSTSSRLNQRTNWSPPWPVLLGSVTFLTT